MLKTATNALKMVNIIKRMNKFAVALSAFAALNFLLIIILLAPNQEVVMTEGEEQQAAVPSLILD
jgi:hypothetical protein